MGRPAADPAPALSKRDEILAVAEEIFAASGFAAASLDDIAGRVGIRRPSVLHHFASKRDIYDAVERDIFDCLVKRTEAVLPRGSAFDRLSALIRAWLDFMVERPTAARIILRNSADLVARASDPVVFSDVVVRAFESVVREGAAAGEFVAVEPVMLLNIVGSGIINFVCNARQYGGSRDYDFTDERLRAEYETMLQAAARAILIPK